LVERAEAGWGCDALSSGTGILKDDDFHEAMYPGIYETFSKGADFAPGWNVTLRTIDFTGSMFSPPDGVCTVDLDGTPGVGAIRHSLATSPSANYSVTFLFSGNGGNGSICLPII